MNNKITIMSCLKRTEEYFNTLIMKRLCFIVLLCLFVFENSNAMLVGEMSMDHQSKKTPVFSRTGEENGNL